MFGGLREEFADFQAAGTILFELERTAHQIANRPSI